MVDRDLRQAGPQLVEPVRCGAELAEGRGEVGALVGEQVEQHAGSDDEHAGVPPVLAGGEVVLRDAHRRLLDERLDDARPLVSGQAAALADVAEGRAREGRLDADRHQPVLARSRDRLHHGAVERGRVGDDVIGGERAHDDVLAGLGRPVLEDRGGQADRRHRVARRRLGEHGSGPQLGQLGADRLLVGATGHDEEPVLDQGGQPVVRLLEKGASPTGQVVQELGR